MNDPDGPLTVRGKFHPSRASRACKAATSVDAAQAPPKPPTGPRRVMDPACVPEITRLLVLGHRFERLVRDGIVQDYTRLARRFGLSKGRVTQLVNLTLLAPDIQDDILRLTLSESRSLTERMLRRVAALADWDEQRAAFRTPRR